MTVPYQYLAFKGNSLGEDILLIHIFIDFFLVLSFALCGSFALKNKEAI